MNVDYRILQELTSDNQWETIGVITHWESAPRHLQLSGIVQHTVSTAMWREILAYVRKHHLTLETYEQAFGEYARYYQLLPEIHRLERETAAEIRQFLRDAYVYGPLTETVAIS